MSCKNEIENVIIIIFFNVEVFLVTIFCLTSLCFSFVPLSASFFWVMLLVMTVAVCPCIFSNQVMLVLFGFWTQLDLFSSKENFLGAYWGASNLYRIIVTHREKQINTHSQPIVYVSDFSMQTGQHPESAMNQIENHISIMGPIKSTL